MDFIKTLFSKLYNPKINEQQDDFPNIPPQPLNTPEETSDCNTEEYNLLPNAELIDFNFEDSDNANNISTLKTMTKCKRNSAIDNILLDLTQTLDDLLNSSNNSDREETMIENDINIAAEKEKSSDIGRNLNNAEFNSSINNTNVEETKLNKEINELIETVSFDAAKNLDFTEHETTNIELDVTTGNDDKNNAIGNVLLNFVKRENSETDNLDQFYIKETMVDDNKRNSTIDKVLLDLDEFELVPYKYEEKEMINFMDVKEPINIDNVMFNDLIDLKDNINIHETIINKIDKQEVNECDFGNELEDILTIIKEQNYVNETVKVENNEMAQLSDNKFDSQKSIKSEILDAHPLLTKIDTNTIDSNKDFQLYKSNDRDVLKEDIIINETERINNIATLPTNKQDCHNTQCFNTKTDIVEASSHDIIIDNSDIIDTISISSTEDLQLKTNKSNIDTISISSNEDLPISKMYNIDILKDSHSSIATEDILKESAPNNTNLQNQNKTNNINQDIVVIVTEDSDVTDSNSECSYHSSDFEFITEKEAIKDGFIINFNKTKHLNETLDIQRPLQANSFNDVPGPSNLFLDNYRFDHVIPEGNDFFNLFQGIYTPDLSNTYMFENKSIHISKSMNVEFEGIGFDMRILSKKIEDNISEEEYKEEAEQSKNRILEMYPGENRPKRMRRQ